MAASEFISDVPIFMDAPGSGAADFAMSRCSFLLIECTKPMPGWTLGIRGDEIPFLLLELVGIIVAPPKAPRFRHPSDVNDLYTYVERLQSRDFPEAEFLVETGDFWLPDFLFRSGSYGPGDVFRVKRELFNLGLSYRDGSMASERFFAACGNIAEGIVFSAEETGVFSAWHAIQAGEAREQFPKNAESVLQRKDDTREGPDTSK